MNVTLTPELEAMVQEKVERGDYPDAGEVVREALLLLEERDRLRRLKAALAIGKRRSTAGKECCSPRRCTRRFGVRPEGDSGQATSRTTMSSHSLPVIIAPRARQDYDDILLHSLHTWGEER